MKYSTWQQAGLDLRLWAKHKLQIELTRREEKQVDKWWCVGINRHGTGNDKSLRGRRGDLFCPKFCAATKLFIFSTTRSSPMTRFRLAAVMLAFCLSLVSGAAHASTGLARNHTQYSVRRQTTAQKKPTAAHPASRHRTTRQASLHSNPHHAFLHHTHRASVHPTSLAHGHRHHFPHLHLHHSQTHRHHASREWMNDDSTRTLPGERSAARDC